LLDVLELLRGVEGVRELSILEVALRKLNVQRVELGIADEPIGFDQSCDGRLYAELGIPTVILGPGDAGLAHTAREHVMADDLVAAVNLYAGLATRYLSRTR